MKMGTNNVIFKEVAKKYISCVALNDISFSIPQNLYTGIIGNNGSGKTTIINIICGLIDKYQGDVFVFEENLRNTNSCYKKKLGVILSNPYYIEDFTIFEYWNFVSKFQGISQEDIKPRIIDLTELLFLKDIYNKPIKNLSSGDQMKVSLGAALIHNPSLLLFDEPFINLDINTIENIITILNSFKTKKTLLITSHNLDLIAGLCDNFLIIDNGNIITEFKKEDFSNIDELKNNVKNYLIKEKRISNIEWLT